MAKVKSLADFVKKWQAGMQGAGAAYQAGVQGTNKDPIQAAQTAEALGKYAANTAAAAAPGGRLVLGLQRSSKAAWQAGCVNVGVRNLATGATKGATKLNGPVGQQLFAAQQAASQAAAAAGSSPTQRWMAAVNAMRAAFGKPGIS